MRKPNNRMELQLQVLALLGEQTGRNPISTNDTLQDLGHDSLLVVETVLELEDEYGDLNDVGDDWSVNTTVAEVIDAVAKELQLS